MNGEDNDFAAYRKLMLYQLEEFDRRIAKMQDKYENLQGKYLVLATKVAIYALLAGFATSVAATAAFHFLK